MAVKIPQYTQQTNTPTALLQIASNPNANPVNVSDGLGRGLQQLGRGLGDASDALIYKDNADGVSRAGKNAADADMHWIDYLEKAKSEAKDGAPNFTGDMMEKFKKYKEETLAAEPNAKGRALLDQKLTSLQLNLFSNSKQFEAQAGVAYRDQNVEQAFQNYARMVNEGKMTYTEAQSSMDTLVANIGYDPTVRYDRATKYRERLADSYWQGKSLSNPDDAKNALSSGFKPANLKPEDAASIADTASRLGISAQDLQAIIGYETGGKFDPSIRGGKNAKHIGLIQFGENEQKDYGAHQGQSFGEQMKAVERYLKDRGVRPGDDLSTLYKIVNGGNRNVSGAASDGNSTIDEHVANIRSKHGGGISKDDQAALRNTNISRVPNYLAAASAETERRSNAALSDAALTNARAVIDTVPMTPDVSIDLVDAKADAVRRTETQLGRTLDPEARLKVEQTVENLANARTREMRTRSDSALINLYDQLDKNGGDLLAVEKDLTNQRTMSNLSRADKDRLNKYAGDVATGGTRSTDWVAYNDLINNPGVLKSFNLDANRDKFNRTEFNQLKKMQVELAGGQTVEDNIQSNLAVVKSLLNDAGIKDDKKEARFFSMLQSAIDTQLVATGKKNLTQAEIKDLANGLLVRTVTDKGVLWDSSERAYNVTVPDGERAKIVAALQANNLPVTEYQILRQYTKKLEAKK